MTDADREIKRLISYIRSCRESNIDCTVTIDKRLTHCVLNALEEVRKYREIGTVEECREAREKQKMKKSIDYDEDLGYFKCPSCGCCIMADEFSDHKYCLNCGQAIQWKESEEE